MQLNLNEMLLVAQLKNNPHAISLIRKLHAEAAGELVHCSTEETQVQLLSRINNAIDRLNQFAKMFT